MYLDNLSSGIAIVTFPKSSVVALNPEKEIFASLTGCPVEKSHTIKLT